MTARHRTAPYRKSFLKTPTQHTISQQENLRDRFHEDDDADGHVFVGVSSTGIYCRPTCRSRTPKEESCTYFESSAEAERLGYRPCMHCRPEIAPAPPCPPDEAGLAHKLAACLREYASLGEDVSHTLQRFGLTNAQLKLRFERAFNATPAMYLQTTRLLLAKLMLFDTNLTVEQVAEYAGFNSTRTLNSHFKTHYHLTPLQMRYQRVRHAPKCDTISVRLGYRPPFHFGELLRFFKARTISGVEKVGDDSYMRTVRISAGKGGEIYSGYIIITDKPDQNQIVLEMTKTLAPIISIVIARVRRLFDLDCDPVYVAGKIAELDNTVKDSVVIGTRLPGCFDTFETVCRAILGQQVSVSAASTLATRIVEKYGFPIKSDVDALKYAWPDPSRIIEIHEGTSGGLEQAFGELGVVKTRSASILTIAQSIMEGKLDLSVYSDPQEQMDRLCEIKGIGPWTANYIAMRALGYSDAFLETDVGIRDALPDMSPKERLDASEIWRPYRSYAIINLWNSLA